MASINHEIFVTITKYCNPCDLKQIAILSKECNNIVQPVIDYIFDLNKELPICFKRWLYHALKSVKGSIIVRNKLNDINFDFEWFQPNEILFNDLLAIKYFENRYANCVINAKKKNNLCKCKDI